MPEFDFRGYTTTLLIVEGLIIPCFVLLLNIYIQIASDGERITPPEPARTPRTSSRRYQGKRRAG